MLKDKGNHYTIHTAMRETLKCPNAPMLADRRNPDTKDLVHSYEYEMHAKKY